MVFEVDIGDCVHLGLKLAVPKWDVRVLCRCTAGHGLPSICVGTLCIALKLLQSGHTVQHSPLDVLLSTWFRMQL